MSMSKTNIYILKLADNKYYVGKSKDPEKRFLEHVNGDGSTWTTKYEPIEILRVIKDASPFDEDKFVKEYMSKFGIKNVRGGSYVKEVLDEIELYNLKKEIWGATDCCTQCGRKGHFIKDCFATTDVDDDSLFVWECEKCKKEFDSKQECENHEKMCVKKIATSPKTVYYNKVETFNCQHCNKEFETQKGATFHENRHCKSKYEEQEDSDEEEHSYEDEEEHSYEDEEEHSYEDEEEHSYEEEEIFNCQYCDKDFDTQKGKTYHENFYCKSKNTDSNKKNKCYRCGRSGHYSDDCYANTHVRGYELD